MKLLPLLIAGSTFLVIIGLYLNLPSASNTSKPNFEPPVTHPLAAFSAKPPASPSPLPPPPARPSPRKEPSATAQTSPAPLSAEPSQPQPPSASPSPQSASDNTPARRLSHLRDQWQVFNRENQFASRVMWEREALLWAEAREREIKSLGRHYRRSFALPHPRDSQQQALTVGGLASPTSPEPAVRAFVSERDTMEKQRTAALDAAGPVGSPERANADKNFEAQEAERLKKHRLQAIALQQAPVEQLQEWRELSRLREDFMASLAFAPPSFAVPVGSTNTNPLTQEGKLQSSQESPLNQESRISNQESLSPTSTPSNP